MGLVGLTTEAAPPFRMVLIVSATLELDNYFCYSVKKLNPIFEKNQQHEVSSI